MGETLHQGAFAAVSHGVNALVFLYGEVMHQPLGQLEAFVRPTRPARLPVVLTQGEVRRVIAGLQGVR